MEIVGEVLVPTVLVIVVIAIALAACAVPILLYLGYRQRTGVMAYAKVQGWNYRDRDLGLVRRYTGEPFVTDADARAESVITGDFWGMPFAAYAYTFQASGDEKAGKDGSATQTVRVVSLLLDTRLPDLDVVTRPGTAEAVAHRFDDTFGIRTSDDAFSQQVLHPRLVRSLLAHPDRGWSIRGGDVLSIGAWNGKPEKIPEYLDHLAMIVHSIPEPVWETYGGRPACAGLASGSEGGPGQPNSSSR
jgi:hypothetical protein